jgi:NitT/TauT family transport system ATP-binding protein
LFPWRTALGNVEFGLESLHLPRKQRADRARHFLSLVGLAGFEDRYPHQLSGGMKQRVAIARSLSYDPDVLLMDEPFAALDAQTRETLQDELLRIWEQTGKTIFFITHAIDEAVYLGRRVAVMTTRPGRILDILDIPLGPRSRVEDVRSSPEFAQLRHRLWTLLRSQLDAPVHH